MDKLTRENIAFDQESFKPQNHVPWSCEKSIYEKLGINYFKKAYMATIGKVIEKTTGEKLKFIEAPWKDGIKDAINLTIKLERIHWVLGGFMGFFVTSSIGQGRILYSLMCGTANVLLNVYPIMLQRYNRLRMWHLFQRMDVKKVKRRLR